MPDNIGKFCFRCLGQILRCQTDLRSDLAAADIDLLLCLCAFIDSGHREQQQELFCIRYPYCGGAGSEKGSEIGRGKERGNDPRKGH